MNYCTSEQAKLLKEKGFDVPTRAMYHDEELIYGGALYNHNNEEEQKHWHCIKLSAPEQWQVIEWLRVNHYINIRYTVNVIGSDEWCYGYNIWYIPKENQNDKRRCISIKEINSFKEGIGSFTGGWDSPQEAYSAAFDYVLTELL